MSDSGGTPPFKALFVCVGNACRSQMGEGFARHIAGDLFDVHSAGLAPAGWVSPEAVAAMRELEIDITDQTSKGIDRYRLQDFDVVLLMGCCAVEEIRPTDFRGEMIAWDIPDPVGQPLEAFRETREQIEGLVRALVLRYRIRTRQRQ